MRWTTPVAGARRTRLGQDRRLLSVAARHGVVFVLCPTSKATCDSAVAATDGELPPPGTCPPKISWTSASRIDARGRFSPLRPSALFFVSILNSSQTFSFASVVATGKL